MKKNILLSFFLMLYFIQAKAKDYIIYNIMQNIPMGVNGEVIRKDFYINMGKNQGVQNGQTVNVLRTISRIDPYNNNKRHIYSVKIGELKVVHSEDSIAIAKMKEIQNGNDRPTFELEKFIIGDKVEVNIEK